MDYKLVGSVSQARGTDVGVHSSSALSVCQSEGVCFSNFPYSVTCSPQRIVIVPATEYKEAPLYSRVCSCHNKSNVELRNTPDLPNCTLDVRNVVKKHREIRHNRLSSLDCGLSKVRHFTGKLSSMIKKVSPATSEEIVQSLFSLYRVGFDSKVGVLPDSQLSVIANSVASLIAANGRIEEVAQLVFNFMKEVGLPIVYGELRSYFSERNHA